jgi:uncharacterized protein GlcG (DUF336 family)
MSLRVTPDRESRLTGNPPSPHSVADTKSCGWRRRTTRAASFAIAVTTLCALISCGNNSNPNAVPPTVTGTEDNVLTQPDVDTIIKAAIDSVNVPLVVAVSDRRGQIIGLYVNGGASTTAIGNFGLTYPAGDVAAALARTAAFFSNDQAPIGSRTVRFLSGIHFPPGVMNVESAPLYGIENTNRGCGFNVNYLNGQSLVVPTMLNSTQPGLGIITGKADLYDSDPNAVNPGGVPIFKNNRVAGGIGVVAAAGTPNYNAIVEYAAVAGTFLNGFGLNPVPYPGAVVVNGITLPFVDQTTRPAGLVYGAATGAYVIGPKPGTGPAPEGDLIAERGSTLGGLTLAQVRQIVQNTVATGDITRAAIRLPVGVRARFVISVADLDGSLLALYRMPDATLFSVDVAVAKARDVIYLSGSPVAGDLPGVPAGTAVTNRTVDFAGQPFYPGGIDGTPPGPFFPLFVQDVANPCTIGSQPKNPNQNGIVFFPGSLPLYINGKLVGGLGVSGDGVDQDDFATAGGAVGFEAPTAIRADQFYDRNVRLTYQKFPPNPTD